MAFTIPNGVTDVIKALSNFPNRIDRLKATQLKAMFDQAAKNVQADVKRLVSELCEPTAAGNIGFARSTEVQADTVQDAIENVQSQIAGVALDTVPNGSIDTAQLANKSVTQQKLKKLELLMLLWEEETSDTLGYIRVTSWPFVRTGHLMPIRWYGGDRTFTRGDVVNVKDATGDVVAQIDIPGAGTTQYFNLKDTATYLILCVSDEDGYDIPPRFTFFDLPTWSDSPEGELA